MNRRVVLTQSGEVDLRVERREKHLAKLLSALSVPRSVEELARIIGVTPRGVYVLLRAIETRGKTLARLGGRADGKYVIL